MNDRVHACLDGELPADELALQVTDHFGGASRRLALLSPGGAV